MWNGTIEEAAELVKQLMLITTDAKAFSVATNHKNCIFITQHIPFKMSSIDKFLGFKVVIIKG